ncbi:YolD-like family protein [Paenibacillus apiarius]|uniref:YolD-like family protein n=1 Tax=Paenibacillus apiarius TaxID=46240 RepID=UPI003B3A2484
MSKKLQANGLFESSRMMLPEHKEAYVRHQQSLERKRRPVLDAQEVEQIARAIAESIWNGTPIRLTVYGDWEERELIGTVVRFDKEQEQIKLQGTEEGEWIKFCNIVGASSAL